MPKSENLDLVLENFVVNDNRIFDKFSYATTLWVSTSCFRNDFLSPQYIVECDSEKLQQPVDCFLQCGRSTHPNRARLLEWWLLSRSRSRIFLVFADRVLPS